MKTILSVVDSDTQQSNVIQALVAPLGIQTQVYTSGQAFIDDYSPATRGCVVMEMDLPDMDGLEVIRQLGQRHTYQPVTIIVSQAGSVERAVQAMRVGVLDFIQKPWAPEHLLRQIQQAVISDASLFEQFDQHQRLEQAMQQLTFRERQVLAAVLAGKPNKQIAAELDLSFKTVSWHRSTALRKLKLASIFDLARQDLGRTLAWSMQSAQPAADPDPITTHNLTIHVRPMPMTRQAI